MSKRVFKFGGASVKDAQSIANVAHALKSEGHKDVCMVVSAMGKTTNAMEVVVADYLKAKNERRDVVEVINQSIAPVVDFHRSIIDELFGDRADQVRSDIERMFDEIVGFITWNKSLNKSFIYDQIVGYGELLSTKILSAYLAEVGIDNTWHDIRTLIKTDDSYRDAAVNWEATADKVSVLKDSKQLIVTQGFLGSDANNFTTTLGREGSDYTAAILAYALDASSVSIWKDVPGVLNADPRYFTKNTIIASNFIQRSD
jgi:aspartate kinase